MTNDADKVLELRGLECFDRYVDASPYLLTNQYVTAVTVVHTTPDGSAAASYTITPDVAFPNATGAAVTAAAAFAALGWHLVDVVLTVTGGAEHVYRYRVFYGG